MADDSTSPTLLGLARDRDPAAWERLVRLYSPLVFHWAKRGGLHDDDAADVVQDVWAAVSVNLGKFRHDRPGDTFRGWLYTVTRNKLHDLARRRADSAAAAGGTDAHRALHAVPEAERPDESAAESAGLLHRALDLIRPDFEDRTWQAFWRTTVAGQPAREVAADLGMAANAVHQAKFRIVRRLRQELTALGVADDPSFAGLLPPA